MRLTRTIVPLVFGLMLVSCVGSSTGHSTTINGNWSAALTGTQINGVAQTFNFTVTLNQTTPPAVAVTNFNFIAPLPNPQCFSNTDTVSSTFSSSGIVSGNIVGAFTLQVGLPATNANPFSNVMNLQGEVNGKTITGNWTATGGASQEFCDASGTFKMTMM
jgi:hypothetical protein